MVTIYRRRPMQSLGLEVAQAALPKFAEIKFARHAGSAQRYPKDMALLEALTVIAHDLRSPLANLSLALELISAYVKVKAYDRAAASTAKAIDMIDALEEMLSGFLRRTRETGDPLSFRTTRIDVSEVVTRAVDLNEPISVSRSLTIDCAGVTALAVAGDKALLVEAVENLVSNAARHAPCGSVISCATYREGRNAVIAITDTGEGLSSAQLQRASWPFVGASAPKQGRKTSWGLGLWIVRLIVERHGGRVEVKPSNKSVGSTIRVVLPMCPA
jgi:two-component system, OmpR family, sensor histidine kinase SenX3